MIICLGATPALQRVMIFGQFQINAVNRAMEVTESTAGKSINVAKVLKVLGESPLALGFAGGDRGQLVLQHLDELGIRHDFIEVEARTRMCVTVIDRGARSNTELVEESQPVTPSAYDSLMQRLMWNLPQARMLILSGTLTSGGPQDFYAHCVTAARNVGVETIVDATGQPLRLALAARPRVAKPNRAELAATVGGTLDSERAILGAMRRLMDMGASSVVVTAGPDTVLAADSRRAWRIGVPKVEAVNSIGSGDAFTAGLSIALTGGRDLGEACRVATACGAANAMTLLAGDLDPAEARRLEEQTRVEAIDA